MMLKRVRYRSRAIRGMTVGAPVESAFVEGWNSPHLRWTRSYLCPVFVIVCSPSLRSDGWCNLADAAVAGVGNIDPSGSIHSNAPGIDKFGIQRRASIPEPA